MREKEVMSPLSTRVMMIKGGFRRWEMVRRTRLIWCETLPRERTRFLLLISNGLLTTRNLVRNQKENRTEVDFALWKPTERVCRFSGQTEMMMTTTGYLQRGGLAIAKKRNFPPVDFTKIFAGTFLPCNLTRSTSKLVQVELVLCCWQTLCLLMTSQKCSWPSP